MGEQQIEILQAHPPFVVIFTCDVIFFVVALLLLLFLLLWRRLRRVDKVVGVIGGGGNGVHHCFASKLSTLARIVGSMVLPTSRMFVVRVRNLGKTFARLLPLLQDRNFRL